MPVKITLITGGAPHYEAGLITGLAQLQVVMDVIGGDDLAGAPALQLPGVHFRNFYGVRHPEKTLWRKAWRIVNVYRRLVVHSASSDAPLIHIQWPYKLAFLDRTALNLCYKALGKKIVFTAHNVDAAARDGKQSWANRFTLWFNYKIVDHIIVHTEQMKSELAQQFGIPHSKISVIPHGIMSAVPETPITRSQARIQLRLDEKSRVLLVFGLIAPYKGLEFLVAALRQWRQAGRCFTLVIAGRVKECPDYWQHVCDLIRRATLTDCIVTHLRHIPDPDVELYFKAADVLVMPYRSIFQSGVIFLAWRFGLPVIATDVGSLREMVTDGKNGFICRAGDAGDLARTLDRFFASELFADRERHRSEIRLDACARYSWSAISAQTRAVYERVLAASQQNESRLPQTAAP